MHQPHAVAVIHPTHAVAKVERLDRHPADSMPSVNRNLAGRLIEPGRDHDVLLVARNKRPGRMLRHALEPLGAHNPVVRYKHRHRRHGRARSNRGRLELDLCSPVNRVHHPPRWKHAAELVSWRNVFNTDWSLIRVTSLSWPAFPRPRRPRSRQRPRCFPF
jgi:hypothetical protein